MGGKIRKIGELLTVVVFSVALAYCAGFLLENYIAPLKPMTENLVVQGLPLKGLSWELVCIPLAIFLSTLHWLSNTGEPAPPVAPPQPQVARKPIIIKK